MATTRVYDGTGLPTIPVKASQAATTLYVKSTGNDANVGSSSSPLLTIQEAINRIPDVLEHAFIIDIGTGSFAGFILGHKSLNFNGNITIQGAMKTATLATGPSSGTSTGGDTVSLVHTGAGWTASDLIGKWVYVNSNLYLIASNTTDTLYIVGSASSMSGKAYVIQDNDTTLTSNAKINGINGSDSTITIQKLKLATGTNYGMYATYVRGSITAKYLYAENESSAGIYCWFVDYFSAFGLYSKNCYNGFQFKDCDFVTGTFMTNGSTYQGFYMSGGTIFYAGGVFNGSSSSYGAYFLNVRGSLSPFDCNNNALGGIQLINTTVDSLYYPIIGTGNTGFGVNVGKYCHLSIKGGTTITGSLGNYSFNNTYARTWATDFATLGDIVVAEDTFASVERVG